MCVRLYVDICVSVPIFVTVPAVLTVRTQHDKEAMRNQVKQVVQRRKTVVMQEAALVAAPVTVQEQLKPKREAMAESRKSRKTLLMSANVDMETLAAEEEEFARMERELQEEEERLLHEEEERVKAEFASLQRMGAPPHLWDGAPAPLTHPAESELAVSTGTTSAAIERRKTRTVTMLLPAGVDMSALDNGGGRPMTRGRGESVRCPSPYVTC